jgi:hypothetical protein
VPKLRRFKKTQGGEKRGLRHAGTLDEGPWNNPTKYRRSQRLHFTEERISFHHPRSIPDIQLLPLLLAYSIECLSQPFQQGNEIRFAKEIPTVCTLEDGGNVKSARRRR